MMLYPTALIQLVLIPYFALCTKENLLTYMKVRFLSVKLFVVSIFSAILFFFISFYSFDYEEFLEYTPALFEIPNYEIIVMCFLAPIVEEIFFRGILFNTYKELSFFKGVLISSIIFSLSHLSLIRMPKIILIGIFLAFLYEYAGSIVAPIMTHISINTCALFVPWLISLLPLKILYFLAQMKYIISIVTFLVIISLLVFFYKNIKEKISINSY